MTVKIITTNLITPYERVLTGLDDALAHLTRIGYILPDGRIHPDVVALFDTHWIRLEENGRAHNIECDSIKYPTGEYVSEDDWWFDDLDHHLSALMRGRLGGM